MSSVTQGLPRGRLQWIVGLRVGVRGLGCPECWFPIDIPSCVPLHPAVYALHSEHNVILTALDHLLLGGFGIGVSASLCHTFQFAWQTYQHGVGSVVKVNQRNLSESGDRAGGVAPVSCYDSFPPFVELTHLARAPL